MKKLLCLLLIFAFPFYAYADDTYVDGFKYSEQEIEAFYGMSQPAVSATNQARLYYDSPSDELMLSKDGAVYSGILDRASADTLYSGVAGTPGGADTQVQYNDGGSFGGDAGFTTDKAGALTLTGAFISPDITLGDGASSGDTLSFDGATGTDGTIIWDEISDEFALSGGLSIAGKYKMPKVDGTVDYVLKTNGLGSVSWQADTGGAGADISDVGDVASGAAFNGTQGTTLTFNNAGGDGVLDYDGTDFEMDKPLTVGGTGASTIGSGLVVNDDSGGATNDDLVVETNSFEKAFQVDASADEILMTVPLTADTVWTHALTSDTLEVNRNTVNLADTTDEYVLAFDTTTQTWRGTAAGSGDITDVWGCSSGDCQTLTAGASDSLNATSASSLVVPHGISLSLATAGGIGIEDTDDQFQYVGGVTESKRTLVYTYEKCFSVEDIAAADDNVLLWTPVDAITVTSMYCRTRGGTSAQLLIGNGTATMDTMTCISAGQADDGSIANASFAAGDAVQFNTGTVTGSVDWTNMCLRYTYDSQ